MPRTPLLRAPRRLAEHARAARGAGSSRIAIVGGGIAGLSCALAQNKRVTASRSELRVTVKRHPALLRVQVFGETHSLEGGPDRPSAVHNVYRHVIY